MTPPPAYLMDSCDKPQPKGMTTNRDLLLYLYDLEFQFDVCAARIEAIRAFYQGE